MVAIEATPESNETFAKSMNLRAHQVVEKRHTPPSEWRLLTGPTISTTKCNAIRTESYKAELQLFYTYSVEFGPGSSRKLDGMEEAIAYIVAQALDSCDIMGRPIYQVKTTTPHKVSKDRTYLKLVD